MSGAVAPKLLLDQGLSPHAAEILRQQGFPCRHVRECGARDASDAAILKLAAEAGECVATFDGDFHELLAWTGAAAPSVIRLRIEGLNAAQQAMLVRSAVASLTDELPAGVVASVSHAGIRVRRLPLNRRALPSE